MSNQVVRVVSSREKTRNAKIKAAIGFGTTVAIMYKNLNNVADDSLEQTYAVNVSSKTGIKSLAFREPEKEIHQ
jgi:hypothetical protein